MTTRDIAIPLLDAPINATWAANHAASWHEKGVRGFLFQGVLDDLRLFPSEATRLAPVPSSVSVAGVEALDEVTTPSLRARPFRHSPFAGAPMPGDWDHLQREITMAVNRLRAENIEHNFLRLRLAPEAAWFADAALAEIAEQRFGLVGKFCAEAGLRGIALDTQSDSAIFDYRWDGYAPEQDDNGLKAGARRFSKRILRAYYRAFPEGEVLLLANRPDTAGPLWYAFMDGVFASVGAAPELPLRLSFQSDTVLQTPQWYRERPAAIDRLFKMRFSTEAYTRWRRQGGLVYPLEPIGYSGDIPTALYPLEHYRTALHAAALHGADYVLLMAPEGGWWHIPADTAAQFTHLHQGGRARVAHAPPLPRALDAFMPRLYFGEAVQVGFMEDAELFADVLRNDKGAALMVWDALGDGLEASTRRGMIVATDLTDGSRRYFTPRDGRVVLPALEGPVFIEGLSLRAFALPASIWLHTSGTFQAGVTRGALHFGLENPLAAPLRGTLSLVTEARYALGAASFPIHLAPGEEAAFQRTVQGISYLGQQPVIQVNLSIAAETPVRRSFGLHIEPEERDRIITDAPLSGAPLQHAPGPRHMPTLFLLDTRGALRCYDSASKATTWLMRLRGGFKAAPTLLRDAQGAPHIAATNRHGRIRIFDADGVERALIFPDSADIVGTYPIASAETDAVDLATVTKAGRLRCYCASGTPLWTSNIHGTVHGIVGGPALPEQLFIYGTSPEDKDFDSGEDRLFMSAHGQEGAQYWQTTFEDALACAPALSVPGATPAPPFVCVALVSGDIHCLDATSGASLGVTRLDEDEETVLLAAFYDPTSNSRFIACATRAAVGLHSMSPDNDTQRSWRRDIQGPTALSVLPSRDGIVVGDDSGTVRAFGRDGVLQWESRAGADAVVSLHLFHDPEDAMAYYCVIACTDHVTRILRIRKDMIVQDRASM